VGRRGALQVSNVARTVCTSSLHLTVASRGARGSRCEGAAREECTPRLLVTPTSTPAALSTGDCNDEPLGMVSLAASQATACSRARSARRRRSQRYRTLQAPTCSKLTSSTMQLRCGCVQTVTAAFLNSLHNPRSRGRSRNSAMRAVKAGSISRFPPQPPEYRSLQK
jgi:hypothetical protein